MNRGENLSFTLILRYDSAGEIPQCLSLKSGLAVSLAIEDFAPPLAGRVLVKWPNDVILLGKNGRGRKITGILVEAEGGIVYIGVGVNIAQKEFPKEFRSKAGSIIQVFPDLPENARFILLEKILLRLYEGIEKPAAAEPNVSWRERLALRLYKKGKTVTFASGAAGSSCLIKGIFSGIGPGGELLIIPEGEEKEVSFVTGELQVYE
jgi:BirA family biotin operon repressor/biotin-[acetyl-CoA-carboxylase] ligase